MSSQRLLVLLLVAIVVGVWLFPRRPLSTATTSSSAPASLPNPASLAPLGEAPSPGPQQTDWEEELAAQARALAPVEETRALSEAESHHTPAIILESARRLGEVWEKAEAEPARREPTMRFLLRCSEDSRLAVAVRAVCWKKLNDASLQWKVFVPFADAEVPEEIRELALEIDP